MSGDNVQRSTQPSPQDQRGYCQYCIAPLPFHQRSCPSLAAYWTEKAEELSPIFNLERAREIQDRQRKAAGSSSTDNGGRVYRTWSLRGSFTLGSRRLIARRSGRGWRRTPSLNGTATTKMQDSLP